MSNLVSASELKARLEDPDLRLVDARFDLRAPDAGRAAFEAQHLPSAVHLDLDRDLAAPPGVRGGRHPLPDPHALARRLGELGIGDEHPVVVYDAGNGMFAARAWWLLRYLGHDDVRVLDGGLEAWRTVDGPLTREPAAHAPATHTVNLREDMAVDRTYVEARLSDPGTLLLDARASERYRGEAEPIDPRAGHIPSARNRPFAGNLENGRFLPAERLRERYAAAEDADDVVVYCGSGVSAAHDVLAMEEAGLPRPRLYVGSWSDWSSDPEAPVATGDESDGVP